MLLLQELLEFLLGEGSCGLFSGMELVCVMTGKLLAACLFQGDLAGVWELLAGWGDVLFEELIEIRNQVEIVGQCLSSLVPCDAVLLFILNHAEEKVADQGKMFLVDLSQGIEYFMG